MGLDCKEPDIELVKLIFSKSTSLEKFIISPSFEGSQELEELVRMSKASPKVDVVCDMNAEFGVYLI